MGIPDKLFKVICTNNKKAYQIMLFQFPVNLLSIDPLVPKISFQYKVATN